MLRELSWPNGWLDFVIPRFLSYLASLVHLVWTNLGSPMVGYSQESPRGPKDESCKVQLYFDLIWFGLPHCNLNSLI